MSASEIYQYALLAAAIVAALVVVLGAGLSKVLVALGAFLVLVAGIFLIWGASFLAVAQLFVYVGGVLVLFLFAVMLVRRTGHAAPQLTARHDPLAAVTAAGVGWIAAFSLRAVVPEGIGASRMSLETLGDALLGPMLAHFEMIAVLLLVALVAVVAVMGGKKQ